MNFQHIFLSAALGALALGLGPAASAQADSFDRIDTNDSGRLSERELENEIGIVLDDWDYTNDGELVDLEVTRAMFDAWDTDGDEGIDLVEFRDGTDVWMPEYVRLTYSDWDLDGDTELSYVEVREGLVDAGYLGDFDANNDAEVTAEELAQGLIAALDADGNRTLERNEWPLTS
jgi:Ca2+-binding EF-hand superfamily protein